jgi:hypothetical protein
MSPWRGWVVLGLILGMGVARGADAPTGAGPAPPDFKIVVAMYGVRKHPIATAELVARHGRVFQFNSDAPAEVIIHDPSTERIELLDLDRMVQTELSWKVLDAARDRLREAIASAIEKREQEGGRANRVTAAMDRDLIDPHFDTSFDVKANHLRLTNPSVEVDAFGEPESDPARLALMVSVLTSAIKLDATRDPKQIALFTRLEALRALTADRHLRPTEMSFLYRLAGPPRKLRWTYRLVPSLTERELEALSRINRLREKATRVRYERYQHPKEGGQSDLNYSREDRGAGRGRTRSRPRPRRCSSRCRR